MGDFWCPPNQPMVHQTYYFHSSKYKATRSTVQMKAPSDIDTPIIPVLTSVLLAFSGVVDELQKK